ncbi:hypothetical protein [Parapedobacter sp. DT-150]|uniref:hypothetical protein n=1 Tax=Parapedobacter sp. DT-150 TaxID=3396162 RepID=UPI003F53EAB2
MKVNQLKEHNFSLLVSILLIFAGTDQFRSFYCLSENQYLTVWKRLGGKCYIIPGKYFGIFKPSMYIETTNDNGLTIVDVSSSEYRYVISNDYGKNVKINLQDQKVKYFDYTEKTIFINEYYTNGRVKDELKYMQIDIKENLVVINGVKQ